MDKQQRDFQLAVQGDFKLFLLKLHKVVTAVENVVLYIPRQIAESMGQTQHFVLPPERKLTVIK